MRKRSYGLLIAAMLISGCAGAMQLPEEDADPEVKTVTAETEKPDETGAVEVVWTVLEWGNYEKCAEELNQKLKQDGYEFTVRIVPAMNADGETADFSEYEDAIGDILEEGKTDIAFLGFEWEGSEVTDAVSIIREGKLLELSEYLDSEAGAGLKNAFFEDIWKSAETDGGIYCIPSQAVAQNGVTIAFNRDYFTEEETAGFNGSMKELERLISEKDWDEVAVPVVWQSSIMSLLESLGYECQNGVVLDVQEGCVVNPFAQEDVKEELAAIKRMLEKGYISIGETGAPGLTDALLKKVLEGDYGVLVDASVDDTLEALREQSIITTAPFFIYNGVSASTGICIDSGHQEEALQLLTLLFTEPEYANILIYGAEGEDYQVIDGIAYNMDGSAITRMQLIFPMFDLVVPKSEDLFPVNRLETKWAYYTSPAKQENPLLGFKVDRSSFTGQQFELSLLLYSYFDKLAEDEKFEALMAEAEEAYAACDFEGLKANVDEQIQEWKELVNGR